MLRNPNPLSTSLLPRRSFLTLAAASATGILTARPIFAQQTEDKVPMTGPAHRDLVPFDQLMTSFVQENHVPGASLAVTRQGRLVYARGFGFADVEQKEHVRPGNLFRIASVSKPVTAVAILKLAEKNRLKLDDKVMDHLHLKPLVSPGSKPDGRWQQITIRQCLQHTGGWDRDKSYDPIGRPWEIAKALGTQPPVSPAQIVEYMLGQPLDFQPGERMAYSNLGYLVLGRIIEAVTGEKYEAHLKKDVFTPLGIKDVHLGRATLEHRMKGEVKYYDAKHRQWPCLYPPHLNEKVPIQYGGENFEGFEAHGGWIASSVDLVRFASAFDDPHKSRVLSNKSINTMWARPHGSAGTEPNGKPKDAYYGCGWEVRPVGKTGKFNTWHTGFIAGSESLLVRRFDGLNWAVIFNTAENHHGKPLAGLIDGRLHEAADQVKHWPGIDHFDKFLK